MYRVGKMTHYVIYSPLGVHVNQFKSNLNDRRKLPSLNTTINLLSFRFLFEYKNKWHGV